MTGFVYFIRCGDFIKVGFSADPAARLREFRIGNPHRLELLSAHSGTIEQEKATHAAAKGFLHQGEWYVDCPLIREFITNGPPPAEPSAPFVPSPVSNIIQDFGGPTAFARAIGVEISTASEMKRRRSIPVRYWPTVISAGENIGKPITPDELMEEHASENAA